MYLQSYSFFFLRAIIIYKEKKGLLAAGKVDCFVRKSGANGIKECAGLYCKMASKSHQQMCFLEPVC
jgi:hypothetical protein